MSEAIRFRENGAGRGPTDDPFVSWRTHQCGSGFPLEAHRLPPRGLVRDWRTVHACVALVLSGTARLRYREGAQTRRVQVIPGMLFITPREADLPVFSWHGGLELLLVALRRSRIRPEADKILGWTAVRRKWAFRDEQLAGVLHALYAEAAAGYPSGELFNESLSVALASYVFRRYETVGKGGARAPSGKLSADQAACIDEYLKANFTGQVGLVDLAGVVGLSPHYFTRLFKNTFEVSPHQYLLRLRVMRSMSLLCSHEIGIADISAQLGFASQSHFTSTFRRLVGVPPGQYRRGVARQADTSPARTAAVRHRDGPLSGAAEIL